MSNLQKTRENFQKLKTILMREQELRNQRQKWVFDETEKTSNLECVIAERTAMLNAVNELRKQAGKGPVTVEQILREERQACGHVDYTHKFALYCAELVNE